MLKIVNLLYIILKVTSTAYHISKILIYFVLTSCVVYFKYVSNFQDMELIKHLNYIYTTNKNLLSFYRGKEFTMHIDEETCKI